MREAMDLGAVKARVTSGYLYALEEAGLITLTSERRRARDGKVRHCKVARVATAVPDVVERGDRAFWDLLRPVEDPTPHCTLTLDELLGSVSP